MAKVSGSKLVDSPVWQALSAHYGLISRLHMRDMFEADPERFAKFR